MNMLTPDVSGASEAPQPWHKAAWLGCQDALLLVSSVTGKVMDANPATVSLLGYAWHELVDMTIDRIIDRIAFANAAGDILDNSARPLSIAAFPVRHKSGGTSLVNLEVSVAIDVADEPMRVYRLLEVSMQSDANLSRLNWALAAYGRSVAALIHSQTLEDVMTRVCSAIVQYDFYCLACVGLADPAPGKQVKFAAGAGRALGFMHELTPSWSETDPAGQGPTGRAIRSGEAHITYDTLVDPTVQIWREQTLTYGLRSSVAVPLKNGDRMIGALLVFAAKPNAFGPQELELFGELSNELAFAITVHEDRKRLKEAENARQVAEQQYLTTFNSVPLGIAHLSGDGRIILANPRLYEIFGWAPGSLTGDETVMTRLMAHICVEDQPRVERAVARACNEGASFDESFRFNHPDGSSRFLRVLSHAIPIVTGGAEYIFIVRDASELNQAEEALRDTEAELARFMRATTMSELAAAITHEVNQPLGAIVTNSDAASRWLAKTPPDLDKTREALLRTVRDAQRATDMLKRIRSTLQRQTMDDGELDINMLVEEVQALMRGRLQRDRVVLHTALAQMLPKVRGDRVQLQQLLVNLITNGIEAMEGVADRPHDLRIRTCWTQEGVQVSVEDSGVGLDPDLAARVFDPFFSTKASGMGMGLAISRSVVDAHGGRIWATAGRHHGTAFQFVLPHQADASR